jgi:hypothetical protein
MRRLIFLIIILSSCTAPKLGTYVSMHESHALYRGFESSFEYSVDCSDCKNEIIEVQGGTVHFLKQKRNEPKTAILKTDSLSNYATIKINCICEKDTILVSQRSYPIIDLPDPELYLGGINLSDRTLHLDTIIFDTTGFKPMYIHHPAISHVKFLVTEYSYSYNGNEFTIKHQKWNQLQKDLYSLDKDNSITINYVKVWYPNNQKKKIYLNRIIRKLDLAKNQFIIA